MMVRCPQKFLSAISFQHLNSEPSISIREGSHDITQFAPELTVPGQISAKTIRCGAHSGAADSED